MTTTLSNGETRQSPTARQTGHLNWRTGVGPGRYLSGSAGLIILVLFADFLFWGYRPGLTLGLFAMMIFAFALVRHGTKDGVLKPTILMALSVLPVFEHVQFLSVTILCVGTVFVLGWLKVVKEGGFGWIASAAGKLLLILPWGGIAALLNWVAVQRAKTDDGAGRKRTGLRGFIHQWSLPVGGSLILVTLLLTANPVLHDAVFNSFKFNLNIADLFPRTLFWVGIGLALWPLLNTPKPLDPITLTLPRIEGRFGFNPSSVLRALIVYNAFLGVQTVLDFSILLGNAALPDGMSYAQYAHRGAYPLIATAMLAGLFALAARPFLTKHKLLKPLLVLWIGQTILLSFSAGFRLDLYIAEYRLTYLRVYAMIWIGVVVVGLITILWHVLRERSSVLLVGRLVGLGLGTLYVCAFVNFADLIVRHSFERAETTFDVDWRYICTLGPTANRAVERGLASKPDFVVPSHFRGCIANYETPSNWRETDFRMFRTIRDRD